MTFKDYVNYYYLQYYSSKSKNEKNLIHDMQMINIILSYNIAHIVLEDISISDIMLFLAQIEKTRKITKATINCYRARLSSIFSHAIQNRLINFNPVKYVRKYKEYPRGRYLVDKDILTLLDECKKSRNKELYVIVVLALNTGMRTGEILNLSHKNILDDHIFLYGEQTKSGLPKWIPLNSAVRNILTEYIIKFGRSEGRLFNSKDIRGCFKCAKKRSGIEDLRFHDLCRTFATHLKNKNIDIHSICKILGHSSITTTERYLGFSESKLLDSVSVLGFI